MENRDRVKVAVDLQKLIVELPIKGLIEDLVLDARRNREVLNRLLFDRWDGEPSPSRCKDR